MSSRSWFAAHRLSASLVAVCAGLTGAGCELEPEPATAIVVSVMTDLEVGTELTTVTYRVFETDAEPERGDEPVSQFTADAQTLNQPFVIRRRNAEELLLLVEGMGGPVESPTVTYRVRARFVEGKTLALRVFLARACYERPPCMFNLTCYGEPRGNVQAGVCAAVPTEVLPEILKPGDESSWEPMKGTPLDAGKPIVTGPRDLGSLLPGLGSDGGICSVARINLDCGVARTTIPPRATPPTTD